MMEYKGYIGRVALDDEAGLFHGEVINSRDVITFQGTSAEEVKREFQASIDVYLDFCAEQGKDPDRPDAGHLVLGNYGDTLLFTPFPSRLMLSACLGSYESSSPACPTM